jgi:hypothetical protein
MYKRSAYGVAESNWHFTQYVPKKTVKVPGFTGPLEGSRERG